MFLFIPLQGRPGPEGSPGAKGYPGRQVQYMASGSSVAMVVWRWPRVPPRQREAAGWGPRSCARWVGPKERAIQGAGPRNPLFEGSRAQDAREAAEESLLALWGWGFRGSSHLVSPSPSPPPPPSTPPGLWGRVGSSV